MQWNRSTQHNFLCFCCTSIYAAVLSASLESIAIRCTNKRSVWMHTMPIGYATVMPTQLWSLWTPYPKCMKGSTKICPSFYSDTDQTFDPSQHHILSRKNVLIPTPRNQHWILYVVNTELQKISIYDSWKPSHDLAKHGRWENSAYASTIKVYFRVIQANVGV